MADSVFTEIIKYKDEVTMMIQSNCVALFRSNFVVQCLVLLMI